MPRRAWTSLILALTVLLGLTAAPAHAIDVAPFFEDAARALPHVEAPELRLPEDVSGLTGLRESEYGLTDSAAISQLDDARNQAVDDIGSAASEVGTESGSSELQTTSEECGKEAFQKAAEDFVDADDEGTEYPDFSDSYYYAFFGCLKATFPDAPDPAVEIVAEYMTDYVSEPAQTAVDTDPTAFANWLEATSTDAGGSTGTDTGTTTEADSTTPPDTSDGGGDGGGSSFPWWLVALGVVGLGGFAIYSSRKT